MDHNKRPPKEHKTLREMVDDEQHTISGHLTMTRKQQRQFKRLMNQMPKDQQLALALSMPTVRPLKDRAAQNRANAFKDCYTATLYGINAKRGPSRQIIRNLLRQRAKAARSGVIA